MNERTCPDCGVSALEKHHDGCDVERCLICGHQLMTCGHKQEENERQIWTGEWPGKENCRDLGLYQENGDEDLNALYSDKYKWDREKQKFVRK